MESCMNTFQVFCRRQNGAHNGIQSSTTFNVFNVCWEKRGEKRNLCVSQKQASNEMKERINSINFFGILYVYVLSCSFGRHSHEWENHITCILRIEFEMNEEKNPSAIVHRRIEKGWIQCSLFAVHRSHSKSIYIFSVTFWMLKHAVAESLELP